MADRLLSIVECDSGKEAKGRIIEDRIPRLATPPILVQGRDREPSPDGRRGVTDSPVFYLDRKILNEQTLKSCLILNPNSISRDVPVMFFDLDNTLYSKRTGIAEEMGHRIQLYFQEFLKLPKQEAETLGRKFYLDYGLAIVGLIRHFQIDAAQYDDFVDGGLELERVLHRDEKLCQMLSCMKARKWVFTNAGLKHALRVLNLLQVTKLFEGIVYCDYCEADFPAKPDRLAYERAMLCAGVTGRPELCYFVDDSVSNVRTARELGWTAIHLDEHYDYTPNTPFEKVISNVTDLATVFGDLFPKES